MKVLQTIMKKGGWLPVTLFALVLINWLASRYHTRIDFTNEKRFTLSKPTKKILQKLTDEVQVDVFLKGEFPSGFRRLANSTSEILQEFKEVAGNKLVYNFISPDDEMEDSRVKWGDTLSGSGLYPINLKSQLKAGEQQQLVYPVALVHYQGRTEAVMLYEGTSKAITFNEINSAEAMMEFRFADAINKLMQTDKPLIAYSSGNGEPGDIRTYDMVNNVLLKDYNLKTLNLKSQPVIPDTFKLLMIVKPAQPFSPEEKLKIDQFVMRGGKLLVFEDKLEAELDSLRSLTNEVVAFDRNLGLDELFFKYGARINSDLVMDLQCDFLPFVTNGKEQLDFLHWNYFPLFESKSNHVINKNMGLVAGQFVNSVDTVEADGIKKTVLLSSSANSRTIATPALISGAENINAPEDAKFKKADIPVAVLLEGKFQSMYTNHLPQAFNDSLGKYGRMFQSQCIDDNKIIIVGDGDMVLNATQQGQPIPMGMNPYTVGTTHEYPFSNKAFLENCLNYLINPSGLSEARAKDYTLRLLDPKKLEAQRSTWQVINIAVPILLIVLFAIIFQWLRRRKYTKPLHG